MVGAPGRWRDSCFAEGHVISARSSRRVCQDSVQLPRMPTRWAAPARLRRASEAIGPLQLRAQRFRASEDLSRGRSESDSFGGSISATRRAPHQSFEQAAERPSAAGRSGRRAAAGLATLLRVGLGGRRRGSRAEHRQQSLTVSALLANAGRGLGRAFLEQDFGDITRVLDTNVTGTLYLIHLVGRDMRARQQGRILITGSIAGLMPGTYQAVYNGTKALLDSFAFALRAELKHSGVSVTCLMPGATETEFFEQWERS